MQVYKLVIDESNEIHIYDKNGGAIPDEDRVIEAAGAKYEINKIGKSLMNDESFAEDMALVSNIRSIISNYYSEREAFIEENHYRILRLAISDTEEDLAEV